MKLSTKSRYALRSMINIASADDVISISEISDLEKISERYLELIFSKLKHARLINSIRGSHGGYHLAKPANKITVYDILYIMENNASIIKDIPKNNLIKKVLYDEIWNPIDCNLECYLKSIKLSDLL